MALVETKIEVVIKKATSKAYKERMKNDDLVNMLLDDILEFQKLISQERIIIEDAISNLESLTWTYGKDISEEERMGISTLISIGSDLGSKWKNGYLSLVEADVNRFASEQLEAYGCSISDFIDAINDLESIYFKLPNEFEKIGLKCPNTSSLLFDETNIKESA